MTTTAEHNNAEILRSLSTRIPVDGVWFDVESNEDGSSRTYWKNGVVALAVNVVTKNEQWAVLVAWAGPEKTLIHEFGPFIERSTADQVAIATGIGVQVAMPARHVSQIPGAEQQLVRQRD